jgi:hypothetical protein
MAGAVTTAGSTDAVDVSGTLGACVGGIGNNHTRRWWHNRCAKSFCNTIVACRALIKDDISGEDDSF